MGKRILIVDDNAAIRKALRAVFECHSEFEICGEAINGLDAVQKTEQADPDLVILDLSMPLMNGFQAADALRKARPALPLILFTAYQDPSVELSASSVGIDVVVSKSEPIETLIDRARTLLEVS